MEALLNVDSFLTFMALEYMTGTLGWLLSEPE